MELGRTLLAHLLAGGQNSPAPARLTLGELWRRYSEECAEYLDNKDVSRRDAASRADVLLGFFGSECPVQELTADDQRRFEKARLSGGITTASGRVTPCTRARSAEADVVLLHTMLRWATTKRLSNGRYLLDRHPLQHVRRVREKNRKQPVATWERYVATVKAMQGLQDRSESPDERSRWLRMEMALFLAERTGRRLGSIRQLRWEDFRTQEGLVFWAAEADKKGYEWRIPMPREFFRTVTWFREQLGSGSGRVFAAPGARDGVMDRHLFDKWLAFAEREAKLPKLDGSLWHAYRRKWAIERKHLPLKDVAAAGGWKDVNTLLEVYQQADDDSVLAVMSEERRLRTGAVA